MCPDGESSVEQANFKEERTVDDASLLEQVRREFGVGEADVLCVDA